MQRKESDTQLALSVRWEVTETHTEVARSGLAEKVCLAEESIPRCHNPERFHLPV